MSNGYGRSAPSTITREQAIRLIVRTCLEEGVDDPRQIAYVLATAQHESQGFTRPEEDYGRQQAARLGYEGGEEYFGRGYAHLTHRENYLKLGRALGRGDEFVTNPALAADPVIASQVLVRGMLDGLFTDRGLAHYITADRADYDGARRIVNLRDRSRDISVLAQRWEGEVEGLVHSVRRDGVELTPIVATRAQDAPLARGDANARAFELQQYLVALNATNAAGRPLSPDGDFGPATEQAVRGYQHRAGIEPQLGAVDQALFERIRAEALRAAPDFRLKSITELYGPLNDRVLGPGDRGDPVADIQIQLRGLGLLGRDDKPLSVSRRYDVHTEAAVRRFQVDENIEPVTGIADEATRDALNATAIARGLPEAAEVTARRAAVVPLAIGSRAPVDAAEPRPTSDRTGEFVRQLLEAAKRDDPAAIRDVIGAHLASDVGQAWLRAGQQQLHPPALGETQSPLQVQAADAADIAR